MGKVAETMTTKRKKKGRPSLLEIQKRTLKQQQKLQQDPPPRSSPNSSPFASHSHPTARSTRRNPSLDAASQLPPTGDDDDERREKKLKLLHGLNSGNSSAPNSAPDWNADGDNPEGPLRRRRIGAPSGGSDETEEKVSKVTHTRDGSLVESGPTTPLPDKKLLVFILERLQKKDTYGVFSEPVDPEELPDYHEIIEHPMDFGTVKSKLDEGAYTSLEQFEGECKILEYIRPSFKNQRHRITTRSVYRYVRGSGCYSWPNLYKTQSVGRLVYIMVWSCAFKKDVLLICSNAMQYNAPDTVFFRQARSMQELAKKDFDNLRQDSDNSEPQPKVAARRGRPPGKNLKKLLGKSPAERVGPEFSSEATLATGGDNGSWPNTYNLRKIQTPDKFQVADASFRSSHVSHHSEAYSNLLSEWENEFPASVLKAVLKYGKKPFAVDENRRESYKLSLASEQEPSVLNTLEGELKQLMAVGVQMEHGYSRSLARFAADLGPRVWAVASKKIESALPNGVKFGPGWVGENDVSVRQQGLCSGKQKSTISSCIADDHINRVLPPNTSGPSSISDRSVLKTEANAMADTIRGLNSQEKINPLNDTVDGGIRPMPNQMLQQDPVIMNGYTGGFMHGFPPQVGMGARAGPSSGHHDEASRIQGMSPESLSRFAGKSNVSGEGKSPWQDPNMRSMQQGSKLRVGSPQQPDLALQL